MNDHPQHPDDRADRVTRFLDGLMDEPERQRFNADLLGDAALRRSLAWYSMQSAALAERLQADPADPLPRRRWRILPVGAIAAAILLATAAGLWFTLQVQPPEPAGSAVPILGAITQARDVVWRHDPPRVGSSLTAGVLSMRSGLVQVELISGATVVVEGPAELELKSPMLAELRRGRARAHVPPPAQGFTLAAPAISVVDRGTEFGIEVDPAGAASVHVFDGLVELHRPDHAFQTLATGASAHIDAAGRIAPGIAPDLRFVGPDQLAKLVATDGRARYEKWLKYSEKLAADPDLRLYYRFADAAPAQRTLRSEARSASAVTDGAIVGCRWAAGRFPNKPALEFKQVTDRVRIDVPGAFASMSFAAWVRIDGFDRRWNSLMLTDGWDAGETHWQLSRSGELILGVKSSPIANYFSPPVLGQSDLGRWYY